MRLWLAYLGYRLRYKSWPSRLQRLYMQGDPTGEVKAVADAVLAEIREGEES
jgi:hypothetical protein